MKKVMITAVSFALIVSLTLGVAMAQEAPVDEKTGPPVEEVTTPLEEAPDVQQNAEQTSEVVISGNDNNSNVNQEITQIAGYDGKTDDEEEVTVSEEVIKKASDGDVEAIEVLKSAKSEESSSSSPSASASSGGASASAGNASAVVTSPSGGQSVITQLPATGGA